MNLANQTLFLTTLLYLTVQGCCTDQTKTNSEASKTEVTPSTEATPSQAKSAVDNSTLVQASPDKSSETKIDTDTNPPATPKEEEMPSETGKVPQKTEEAKGSGPATHSIEDKKDEKKGKEKHVGKPQKIPTEGEKVKSEDKAASSTPPVTDKKDEKKGKEKSVGKPQEIPTEEEKVKSEDKPLPPQIASIGVEVNYYYRHKEDTGFFKKLESNSQLFSGDLYAIKFTPKEEGYVYVYQVSGNDEIQDLMEKSKRNNRVVDNETVILPAKIEAFLLDDMTGQEEIYVLAFKKRNMMLENQYAALSNNSGDKIKLQEEMLNMLKETVTEKVSFKHDKKTNTKETQP